jgi:hypothetical protein
MCLATFSTTASPIAIAEFRADTSLAAGDWHPLSRGCVVFVRWHAVSPVNEPMLGGLENQVSAVQVFGEHLNCAPALASPLPRVLVVGAIVR